MMDDNPMVNCAAAFDNLAQVMSRDLTPVLLRIGEQLQAVYALLEAEAQRHGMTIEEYIDYCATTVNEP